jgi:dihydrodipicolinate synthase/N-acetylneuraminate lyase
MLYNFPSVSNAIDLDSDFIVDVIKQTPNVCGVKLTLVSLHSKYIIRRLNMITDVPMSVN